MKLKNILNEERIGVEPKSIDEIKIVIKNNCYENFKIAREGSLLYRGANYNDQDFLFIDPSKRDRTSLSRHNYHNLFIDNFPEWMDYPKRSKSINVSTELHDGLEQFGSGVYVVIPFNTEIYSLNQFNEDLCSLFTLVALESFPFIKNFAKIDYNTLIEIADFIIKRKINYDNVIEKANKIEKEKGVYFYEETKKLFKKLLNGNILTNLRKMFNPKKNGFSVINNYKNLPFEKNVEVWTDAPCVLIKHGDYAKDHLIYSHLFENL